jgi:hypothetical protein
MTKRFDEYEKHAKQLEKISKTLSKKSMKYVALKRAAFALGFVTMNHHAEFEKFLSDQLSRTLSADEERHLRDLGLE